MSNPGTPSPFLAGEDSNAFPNLTTLSNLHSLGRPTTSGTAPATPSFAPFPATLTPTSLYHPTRTLPSPNQDPLSHFQSSSHNISGFDDPVFSSRPISSISTDNRELRAMYIACADHEQLRASGNPVYQQCLELIKKLQAENADFRTQLTSYKNMNDNLIRAVPQLLGIESTSPGLPNPTSATAPCSDEQSGVAAWAHTRITLGQGMRIPAALPKPPGIIFLYWTRTAWNQRHLTKSTRKRGERPQEDENVLQLYIEEVHEGKAYAEPASGHTVAQIRALAYSLAFSLRWSGQAPSKWSEATHEVHAYVYSTLAHYFPMLLYCEGGSWKMDLLMSKLWPAWVKTHLAASSAPSVVGEKRPGEDWYATPPPQAKRSRNVPSASVSHLPSPTPPPCTPASTLPTRSTTCPASSSPSSTLPSSIGPSNTSRPVSPSSSSIPPPALAASEFSTSPPLASPSPFDPSISSEPLTSSESDASAGTSLECSTAPATSMSPAPILAPTPSIPITTSASLSTSVDPAAPPPVSAAPVIATLTNTAGLASSTSIPSLAEPASPRTAEALIAPAPPIPTPSPMVVQTPNPFPVLRRTPAPRRIEDSRIGSPAASPSIPGASDGSVPEAQGAGQMSASTPGPSLLPESQTVTTTSPATVAVLSTSVSAAPDHSAGSIPSTARTSKSSRRGGRTARLARETYDPSKSSGKNIFIARMIDQDKDVTDSDCQKAWSALSKDQKQEYNKEATENQRAQRASERSAML